MNPLATIRRLFRRPAAHHAPRAAAPYRAGEVTRLNRTWQPESWAGDNAIAQNWDLLTSRVRDLARNDPSIIALRNALTDHVIADGLRSLAAVTAGDDLHEVFNRQADELFEEWEQEADVDGRLSWPDLQRQVFEEMLDTGDGLLLRCARAEPDRQVPLCYQVLEAEQLDTSKDRPAGAGQNAIRRGVEVDRFRRPVAYYLFDTHPADTYAASYESRRIPAARVIHLKSRGRPSETRGVSLHRAITQPARDLDTYLGSELTAGIIGSLLTLIHKTANPGNGLGLYPDAETASDTTMADGSQRVRLGRGIVAQIGTDDEVEVAESKRPNRDAKEFIQLIQMLIGMGGGVSRYRLTRDYSGTTYVAGRAARLDDQAHFRPLQGYLARQIVLPVRRAWTIQAAAYGLFAAVTPRRFARELRRWVRLEILPPGVEQLDPAKETDADLAALAAGTTTYQDVWARKGRNWRRAFRQRAREKDYAEELGLVLSYDRPSMPASPAASTNNGEDQ